MIWARQHKRSQQHTSQVRASVHVLATMFVIPIERSGKHAGAFTDRLFRFPLTIAVRFINIAGKVLNPT